MNEQQFRDHLIESDHKSIDSRISRWKRLTPAVYSALPKLLFPYLAEAVDMFIRGHFIGAILMTAAILEITLKNELTRLNIYTETKAVKTCLKDLIEKSYAVAILNEAQYQKSLKLNDQRNALIHVKHKELNNIANIRYEKWGLAELELDAGLYLTSTWNDGIEKDAEEFLKLTRDITANLFGSEKYKGNEYIPSNNL
ncbi:hypothetical protein [Dehalococcoides sp.]|uniref:hypothetical protein n=1 Tax=Dehalococcoides sp. TaxID=1966486 RepID=UPI002ACB09A3|nr:hypothetical protein [Dehalococcoides sp.]